MEIWTWILILILCVVILVLAIKICLMRKGAREIQEEFADRLNTGSNTLIGLSSSDKYLRSLADAINTQLRELSVQRQRFQHGDIEVKNAITNISHDIRTPLTAICGYLELLAEEDVSETAAQYIKIIENRTEKLKEMTEELFDYSVDMSKKLEVKKETVDVNRMLQESIAAFYAEFMECNITPNIRLTENQILRQADPAALSRVFENLLSNAIKYSDGDLDIVLSEKGDITFANTAADLSNIEVGRLFDRFYTIENARRSRGLGLAIAKLLIEKMQGEITAEYANGKLIIQVRLSE